ncbi:MAG: GNAT family N-acetyltransferase [Mucilaginibacter sp.]
MDAIEIKEIGPPDIEQLQGISKQTFVETYADLNTKENMQLYLDENFTVERLTNELANPASKFYFALLNNQVIGYLKLNFGQAQTELKDQQALEIERIYVLKEFHGKRVGQAFYDRAVALAKETNAEYIWLGVWEKNPRAKSFYTKNGFVEFDRHIFKLGTDEQTDIMMKLQIPK